MRSSSSITAIIAACILTATTTIAQTNSTSSKRGIAYIAGYGADYALLLSTKSPMNWYYTWLPTTAPSDEWVGNQSSTIEFVPTLKSIANITTNLTALANLPASSTHLFTFNEPDGTIDTGGSDMSPVEAAQAYIQYVVPLRSRYKISHPVTTGSPRGFKWLNDFVAACWAIDATNGCPTDFVVVHWYGDFAGMAAWIGQIADWYKTGTAKTSLNGDLKMWVTEIGLPQGSNGSNYAVMEQSLPYLDELSFIERYAWFGVFRPVNANVWTGDGLSLFRNDGGLSELGALYLGGEANGFAVGDKGQIPVVSSGNGSTNSTGNDTGNSTGDGSGNSTGSGSGNGGNGSAGIANPVMSILWACVVTTGFLYLI